ncbi:hypothetical protein L6452_18219 [Arctium lappa]|uniref:Uncharacterized protein n=1 Tax=Arctium lappa TaxID=4217 RepID=A0ACB9C5X0_ARCLA|nr:hypothetical protein L6452_18219 [Arctium lappa]
MSTATPSSSEEDTTNTNIDATPSEEDTTTTIFLQIHLRGLKFGVSNGHSNSSNLVNDGGENVLLLPLSCRMMTMMMMMMEKSYSRARITTTQFMTTIVHASTKPTTVHNI